MEEIKKTDWRKFRKSTHLASPDLEVMLSEGKELEFTIKEVKHEKNVNVSGTKMDGFFCYFKEDIKPMKINNTNLKMLSKFAKKNGIKTTDIFMVENYKGLFIELYVDNNVSFMGGKTDGIRIRPVQPVKQKPVLDEKSSKWKTAKEKVKEGMSLADLSKHYSISQDNYDLLCG